MYNLFAMFFKNDSPATSHTLHKDNASIGTARPQAIIVLRPIDLFLIPASLVCFSIPLIVLSVVAKAYQHPMVYLLLSPFLLPGIYMTLGRFFKNGRHRNPDTLFSRKVFLN